MSRILVVLIALSVLGATAVSASGDPAGNAEKRATARASGGKKKVHCKKGYVKKHKHGKVVCVKKKPTKFVPHPGLDVAGTPGTYKGTHGVIITTSAGRKVSFKITYPSGNVSCGGIPPYPSITVSFPRMDVSDMGQFGGATAPSGANVVIQGHFTGPNKLTLDSAGASNYKTHGQRCAAQYSSANIVF